ncbi:outer membrane protein assembly factor BamD [Arboricoccus pini]|nr:outer membrane protein assembly factor BamD [Arboricoccus pini]
MIERLRADARSAIVGETVRPARRDAKRNGWNGTRGRIAASLLVLTLAVAGCTKKEAPYIEQPVDDLYNKAQDQLQQGNYAAAASAFEEVDRQHPYSEWATRAQLMSAYAYYEANDYDASVDAAQRYIDLHPGAPDVDYAYYLIGVDYYERISDVRRDQEMTQKARDAFNELIRRFPDSDYARDAKLKVDLTEDHLAGKEMAIGRYYQDRGEYVAAINRFRAVLEGYQTTTQVPEALMRLVECYLALGVRNEAQNAAAVLGYNFPETVWYERAYSLLQGQNLEPKRDQGSWLSRIF